MQDNNVELINILLVEDEPGDAGLIRRALQRSSLESFDVTWVKTLAEGCQSLSREKYDLVLLDLSLPDSSGLETVRAGCVAAGDTPLVVLTGRADAEFALSTLDAGAQDYLVKGEFDHNLLTRSLRYALARARAEAAQRQSEARHRLLSENAPVGLFQYKVSADGTRFFPYISNKIAEIAAIPAEAIQKDHTVLINRIHPAYREAFSDAIQESAEKLTDFHQTFLFTKDSGEIWLEMRSTPEQTPDGGILWNGVLIDIDQRKKAEEALFKERERLNNIIEGTNAGTWECNLQTGEARVNERWAQMLGHTLAELAPISTKTLFTRFHPVDYARAQVILHKHIQGELEFYDHEARMKHKNGSWLWVHGRGKVISWTEGGKPLWMFGTHLDINARKQAEKELALKEKILLAATRATDELLTNTDYYDAIAKSLEWLGAAIDVDRVYLFENDYDRDNNLRSTSQKIEWNGGVAKPQLNNPALQNIPVADITEFMEPLSKNRPFQGVVRELDSGNVKKMLEAQQVKSLLVLSVFVKNRFWGFVGYDECKYERAWSEVEHTLLQSFAGTIAKAIERKNMEEELAFSKKAAEAANLAKRQFLANMSHEIRTPFSGVLGMIDLLAGTTLTPEQQEYIGHIRSSAASLLNIINDILDISKIEAGTMEATPQIFHVHLSILEAVQVFEPVITAKGIAFNYRTDPDIPALLYGDNHKISQILTNLLSNAQKFTKSGKISLDVSIAGRSAGSRDLKFTVSDTGIGIPKERIEEVLNPFMQVDYTISKQYGGAGLGLYICKNLVKLLGGEISIESTYGRGTAVSFTVPLKIAEQADLHEMAATVQLPAAGGREDMELQKGATSAGAQPLHILVAEDDLVNQIIITKILAMRGHSYKTAVNGKEAVELFREEEFDMVLMDIQMPVMDGYTAATLMRSLEKKKKRKTSIVALTAHAMAGDMEKSLNAGMDYHLPKPLRQDDLHALIGHISKKYGTIGSRSHEGKPPAAKIQSAPLDLETLFMDTGQDLDFLEELLHRFRTSTAEQLAELEGALHDNNAEKVKLGAHKLKGSFSVVCASEGTTLANILDQMGSRRELEGSADCLAALKDEVGRILTEIRSFIDHRSGA